MIARSLNAHEKGLARLRLVGLGLAVFALMVSPPKRLRARLRGRLSPPSRFPLFSYIPTIAARA